MKNNFTTTTIIKSKEQKVRTIQTSTEVLQCDQFIIIYIADVVEWSRALDIGLSIGGAVYQWCEFKSRRGKNKHLTAQRSNSNTVWFNFQTYIYIYIQLKYLLL
jgi:hypothetical protein